MQVDEKIVLLGEDLLDPYGGAFKVTQGLSSSFPDRVWSSPISEAGMVGLAAGMAMRGLRPVVEIMFGDFITLAADQLVNHIAKFRWMYNEQVQVPLVIRAPMGGRRGYGPTHSQTLEKFFLGVPGLKVIAPCDLQTEIPNGVVDAGELLFAAIQDADPVLFIENKLLYLSKLQTDTNLTDFEIKTASPAPTYPAYLLKIQGAPPASLTIASYGYMSSLARQAALQLAYEHEIFCELFIPTQLSPFQPGLEPLLDSVRRTHTLLTVEEGNLTLGWGAEIIARATENLGSSLKSIQRVAAAETPIPASGILEEAALPDVKAIITTAQKMV
jgi:pyruvate/2-oxoglutarate/acetoin dehydrogenase E1 component